MQEQLLQEITPYRAQKGAIIPVLQRAQERYGYLSEEIISEIADFLGLTKNEVYGVASFYALFRFEPQGEHVVKVCQGTACHVRGARRLLEAVDLELSIKPGQMTEDHKFSLERVACFGACAMAPVVVIDDVVYGNMSTTKVQELLAKYQDKKQ